MFLLCIYTMMNTVTPINETKSPMIKISGEPQKAKLLSDEKFDNITLNNDKNSFLKDYVMKKLAKSGIELHDGWEINVASPEKISKEDNKLLRDVRVNTYKARVDDLFKLLEKDSYTVNNRIREMKISQEEKDDLTKLKSKYDNYYTIILKTNDKEYNLFNLTEQEKAELKSQNPELVEFTEQEKDNIDNIKKQFASSEIKKEVLAESGKSSRYGAYALVPVLLVLGAQAVFEQRAAARAIKSDAAKYLREQIAIYNEGNPLRKYFAKGGFKEYVNSMK